MLLICIFILCGCKQKREDFFELSVDNYSITVGYDSADYLKTIFDIDLKEEFEGYEKVKDVDINLFNKQFAVGDFSNSNKKPKSSKDITLSKLTIYLNDLEGRTFKLNGEQLDTSIKNNCSKYGGTYIEKNGYACVIESNVDDKLNVVEMYGDYINIDQDQLDHITIYID